MILARYEVPSFPTIRTRIKCSSLSSDDQILFKHCSGGYESVDSSKEREILLLLSLHGEEVTIVDEEE